MNETIKWIDATKEKPENMVDVLLFGAMCESDKNLCVWPGYYSKKIGDWMDSQGNELEKVTHWAAMPEGPEVQP